MSADDPVVFRCSTRADGTLSLSDLLRVSELIEDGALCLLPSDSSYALTGSPIEPGLTDELDEILMRDGLEMSLAFGSYRKTTEYAEFTHKGRLFAGAFMPGGLTFITQALGPALEKFANKRLHARNGKIGVRLTDSRTESQIAFEADLPLPTTPVRADGRETRTAEEALAFVLSRYRELGITRDLVVVDGNVQYSGRLSTVVNEVDTAGLPSLHVIRVGALDLETITPFALDRCNYESVLGPDWKPDS